MAPLIEVQALEKRYGAKAALRGVTFSVEEGEAFGYLGPNGAGKTTTIRCMLGLIRPSAGAVRLFGRDALAERTRVAEGLGYLPGEFGLWPQMTGRECLGYLGRLHPHRPARMRELCEQFELSGADLDRQVRVYSRGMRQKIGIVQAFQHDPNLVVLDEPTEGLDPVMKERFVELLAEHRQAGGTAFLSSHILSEVEEATSRVGVLRAGRLAKLGPTADLTGERIRHCTVTLREPESQPALSGLSSLSGLSDLRAEERTLHFSYRGDMGPLLEALRRLPVADFLAEPERLSEAFFEVYGEDGHEAATAEASAAAESEART